MISFPIILILAVVVACISWTVTHEALFAELHEYSVKKSKTAKNPIVRKLFYLFTCEYCFSHYVTILLLVITKTPLLYTDWRGYIIAGFSIVWIANIYMSIYSLMRVDLKLLRKEAE